MDISAAGKMANSYMTQAVSQDVGIAMTKKAMDIEQQAAAQMIQNVQQATTPTSALPDNVGRNINVVA